MSTLLNMRAYRVVMLSVATIMVASLLAPIVAIANTDLAPGDSAVVSGSDGANLRSDTSLTDETIIAELPAGTTVWVNDGPYYEDTGVWVYVAADGYGPGFITTALLSRIGNDELAEANGVAEPAPVEEEAETVTSGYAWLEPIDSLVVVDYNAQLTEQGLPVLADAYDGAPVLGYIHIGGGLDVTSERIWQGDANFVRVNFNGEGAFVDGDFVELASEYVEEVPTEEVIWLDEPTEVVEEAPVEEPVVEEAPVEEPVVEEAPVEEPIVEEAPAEEPVVEEAPVEEPVVEEAPVEEPVVDEAPVEEPVTEEVSTPDAGPSEEPVDEVPTEEPVVEEVVTEVPVTEEVSTPDAGTSDEPVDEVPTEEPVVEEVVTEVPVTEEVSTPDADTSEEPVAEVPTDEAVETQEATEEVVTTQEPTGEATVTQEATEAPAEEPQVVEQAPIATTADAFDVEAMIGSATVTGTTSGLLCRTEPSPSAPALMTLTEGTKVLVSAEPVNGYLGINCGGLQGFGDVNYLWSGGAGDEEITASRMNVVVTGTGNGLNCRTGAGLDHSIITTLWDGTSITTRGAASNGWTPVTCAGQNGFVSTTWIEVAGGTGNADTSAPAGNASSGSAVVNTGGDGLYCRTGAGTTYGIITVLRHGSSVAVRGAQQGDWIPVTCGGSAGFAHGAYLDVAASSGNDSSTGSESSNGAPSAAIGSVTVANTGGMGLNCRTGAGTTHSIITTLALGQSVQTRSGSTSGWTAVICGGTNGFVSSEFISGASAGTTPADPKPEESKPAPAPSGMRNGDHAKITSNLNLRYSASLSSSVATTVETGKVVLITGAVSNDFYPVDYDGLKGFMHKDYLTKTSAALSERGGSAAPEDSASKPDTPKPPAPDPAPPTGTTSPTGNAMVNYAMRYVGYPYVWATRGPASFDCSGFTYWVTLNVTGKNIGAGTWTQVSAGTPVSKANLQPGDLVFFQNTYTAGLSHVGLYIGNGQFIHAQNEATGVVISDLDSSYYGPRWYGAVRL